MTTLYLILAGLGAVVLLALLYGYAQRRRGREETRTDTLEAAVDTARKGNAIDEDVKRLPDDVLYDELYDRLD